MTEVPITKVPVTVVSTSNSQEEEIPDLEYAESDDETDESDYSEDESNVSEENIIDDDYVTEGIFAFFK